MKGSIVIKSNPYGITLIVNKEQEFESLVREICAKFAESRAFWGSAKFNLTVEGAEFSDQELAVIVEAIEINSDISINLVEGTNGIKERQMLESEDKFYFEKAMEHAKIIKGNISKNEEFTCDSSLLILGDIKSGASVKAAGSIIVLGTVAGNICAGSKGNKNAFIIAGDFKTAEICIASVYGPVQVHKKWALRRTKQEMIAATLWRGEICCEPLGSGKIKQQ